MLTVALAWLAVLAVLACSVLFGQTARSAPPSRRPRPAPARLGLVLSLAGPWLVVLPAAGAGALTGAWLPAAASGACGVVLVAVVGVLLHPW